MRKELTMPSVLGTNVLAEVAGAITDFFEKLAGPEGTNWLMEFKKFLRKESCWTKPTWMEKDGVIHLSVTSYGTTGSQWITRLEKKDFRLSKWAKDVLNSPNFKSTTGITYNCVVLKGEFFSDEDRITSKIRAEADKRKFAKPNAEVACLIRENFSDEDIEAMGLIWLVTMHEPINDSGGAQNLLCAHRYGVVGRRLSAFYGYPSGRWRRVDGFVFLAPQDQPSV